jgi:hypothetical protein
MLAAWTAHAAAQVAQPDRGAQTPAPTAFAAREPQPVLQWGVGDARSLIVPAYEIPAFQLLLNRYDHYALDASTYPSPLTNFRNNLHRTWVVDNDPSNRRHSQYRLYPPRPRTVWSRRLARYGVAGNPSALRVAACHSSIIFV